MRQTIGERALLLAILERALIDASGTDRSVTGPPQRDAMQWLKYSHPDDVAKPFTFLWVCEQLDVCPERVREIAIKAIETHQIDRLLSSPVTLIEHLDLDRGDTVALCGLK